MYEINQYTSINNLGTAVLLEALLDRPVERLVVASSMSVYGEGLYNRTYATVTCDRLEQQVAQVDRTLAGNWLQKGNASFHRPVWDVATSVMIFLPKERKIRKEFTLSTIGDR
jgi:dTDP-L-rhamnose 4-epimerase